MNAARRVIAVFWLLAAFGYCLAQPSYSNWWMFKTVVVTAFVFGLIWPDKPKEEEPEKD